MSKSKTYTFRLTGQTPLLMKNIRTANPLDPIAKKLKALSSKRGKTDEDYEELARWEFAGAIYLSPEKAPCIPGYVLTGCLKPAARKFKLGPKLNMYCHIPEPFLEVEYDGPKTWEELFALRNGEGERPFVHQSVVTVDRKRVQRTRPGFPNWGLTVPISIVGDEISQTELISVFDMAGLIGLCDGRSIGYGRFVAELME